MEIPAPDHPQHSLYRDAILHHLRANGPLERIPEIFWGDREVMVEAIKRTGLHLSLCTPEIRHDREVVMLAVQNDGAALQFVAECFLSDKEVVIPALLNNGRAIVSVSDDLLEDKDVIMAAAHTWGMVLHFAASFRDDFDVALEAVRDDGMALRFCSRRLQETYDIAKTAVCENGNALPFVAPHLQDRELTLCAAMSGVDVSCTMNIPLVRSQMQSDWVSLQGLLKFPLCRWLGVGAYTSLTKNLIASFLLDLHQPDSMRYLRELRRIRSAEDFDFFGMEVPYDQIFEPPIEYRRVFSDGESMSDYSGLGMDDLADEIADMLDDASIASDGLSFSPMCLPCTPSVAPSVL